jgi:hypothetical protein
VLGALLNDLCHFLHAIGLMGLLEQVHGANIQRAVLPFVQYILLYGLKTLFVMASINALLSLLFSDEVLMQLVGFNAQKVRRGICRRGATKRQNGRLPRPISLGTLAKIIVKGNLQDLKTVFKGSMRALAQAEVFGAKVTVVLNASPLKTTQQYGAVTKSPASKRS